jgi:hypothetical protein
MRRMAQCLKGDRRSGTCLFRNEEPPTTAAPALSSCRQLVGSYNQNVTAAVSANRERRRGGGGIYKHVPERLSPLRTTTALVPRWLAAPRFESEQPNPAVAKKLAFRRQVWLICDSFSFEQLTEFLVLATLSVCQYV